MQKQISAIISLKDRFSGPLLKMSKNIESLDKETRSSMNRVNRWGKQVEKSVDRAVKATAKWAKRGAILATGWSIKSGFEGTKELDYAARKVKSIAGERLNFSDIMQDIKDFSFEFGKTYEEIGDGFYNAISASIPMDLLNQAVELGNQLSIAGFTDMDSSISLMASTMNAFDMKTSEEMQNMADQFLLTQNLGVITVDEMAQYYGRISTLSGQIGASLEEQNAAMATMTMRGMTQREATTSYRSILNAFLKNTSDSQQAAIEAMGLSSDFLTAKTFNELGFDGVVEEIARAAKGDLDLISEIFPDIRGKIGAIMFGPDAGMDDFKRILEEMQSPEGVLDDAHAELNNSVERQWDIFKNRIRTLNDELYTEEDGIGGYLVEQLKSANDWLDNNRDDLISKINETSEKIIEGVKNVFDFYNKHEDTIKKIGKTLAGMYIFTKVVGWVSAFSGAMGTVINVIKAITGGKVIGGGVISGLFTGLVKWMGILLPAIGKVALAFMKLVAPIALLLGGVWLLITGFKALKEGLTGGGLSGALDSLKESFGTPIDFIKGKWEDLRESFGIEAKPNIKTPDLEPYRRELGLTTEKSNEFNLILDKPYLSKPEFINQRFNKDVEESTDLATGLNDFINQYSPFSAEAILQGHLNFRERARVIRQEWSETRDHLSKPIVGQATILMNRQERKSQAHQIVEDWRLGTNYKGTPSWKGGLTQIHERGGEIMDLPSGTRIYPHDESVKMARSEGAATVTAAGVGGQSINVNLGGINFSGDFNTDADINEIGTKIVNTIKKELKNI